MKLRSGRLLGSEAEEDEFSLSKLPEEILRIIFMVGVFMKNL